MKNKIITYFELLELIKDNKPPKEIKYNRKIFKWTGANYLYVTDNKYFRDYLRGFSDIHIAGIKIEILPEENEWENIKEYYPKNRMKFNIFSYKYKINQLIKNQKCLKEMVQSLQKPFMDEIRVDTPKWIEDPKKRKVGE